MNKWQTVSEFVIFSTKGITPKYVDSSSIIVLNQKCIRNGTINYSYAQFTDDTKQIQQSKFVKKGDILINSTGTGTAGRCAFVSEIPENHKLIVDSHILILRCNSFYEAQCLSYSLFSFEKTLMSFMTGSSGQSELDKVALMNLKTKIPTNTTTQQKIASILSSLDSKIELNNHINAELEAMAKMIYDYWFVQFDFPDEKGKPYKTSCGKMVWNEELKREIPDGWEVKKIEEVATVRAGGDKPDNYSIEKTEINNVPIYSNGITNDGLYGFTSKSIISEQSVTISARGTIGFCVLRNKPYVPIIRLISLTPNIKGSAKYFYETLKNFIFENSGSVQQQLIVPQVADIKILYPKEDILKKFDDMTSQMISKIEIIKEENQKLIELRDWLLPMLMNGQVRIINEEETELLMAAEPQMQYGK